MYAKVTRTLFASILILTLLITSASATSLHIQQTEKFFSVTNKIDSLYYSFLNSKDNSLTIIDSTIFSNIERAEISAINEVKNNNYSKIYELLSPFANMPPDNFAFYDLLTDAAKSGKEGKDLLKKIKNRNTPKINLLKFLVYYKTNQLYSAKSLADTSVIYGSSSPFFNYYLSYVYRGLGDYKRAGEICKIIISSNNNDFILSKFENALGSIFYLSGDLDSAKKYYELAEKKGLISGNKIELIKAKINLGILADDSGNIYEARKYFNSAINLATEIQNQKLLALTYSELATSYTFTGELIRARSAYIKSYNLYLKTKEQTRLSLLANNIGNLFVNIGNYYEAKKYYEDGLDYAGDNIRARALNLIGLGDIYTNLSNYSEGLFYYNIADSLGNVIKEYSISSKAKEGIGILYFNIGDFEYAINQIDSAISLANKGGDEYSLQELFYEKALMLGNNDELNDAKQILSSVIAKSLQLGDVLLNINATLNLAELELRNHKTHNAIELLKSVEHFIEEYELKYQLVKLYSIYGECYKELNSLKIAEKYFNKSIEIANSINDHNELSKLYYLLAKINYNINKKIVEEYFDKSFAELTYVLNALTKTDKLQIDYLGNYYQLTEDFVDFLLKAGKEEKAFTIFEKSKAFNTYRNILKVKLSDSLLTKYLDIKWKLSSGLLTEAESDSLSKIENKLYAEIKNNKYGFEQNNIIEQLQKKLNDNQAYISIYQTTDYSNYFVVTKNAFNSIRVNYSKEKLKDVISKISPYYDEKNKNNNLFFNQDLFAFNSYYSNKLYKEFLAPALTGITEKTHLIFSTSNSLAVIPLEFLVTEYNESYGPYRYDKVKFLIEKYNISYALSAKVLLAEEQLHDDSGLLVMGDPDFGSSNNKITFRGEIDLQTQNILRTLNFAPLTYSKTEIESISDLFDNVTLLESKDATEINFKKFSTHKSVIHLSTHAFLNKSRPAIVFTPSGTLNSCLLEPGEIASTNLHSNLVVLSACRTALGKVINGEGIIGMQKVFTEAGAQNIISTLWDINDKYSSKFMKIFYSNLSRNNNPASALRQTKIEFIKNVSPNPYYWAAFVLTGNNSAVNLDLKLFSNYIYLFVILIFFSILILRKKKALL